MSAPTQDPLEDEKTRLLECGKEQIRIPGAVQPHGVMLAVESQSMVVEQASVNTQEHWGIDHADVVGHHLRDVVGEDAVREISAVLSPDGIAVNPVRAIVNGAVWDVVSHRADSSVLVEFEPATDADPGASAIYAQIHRLAGEPTVALLLQRVAREVRRMTGFDRVVVYEFHQDGHGEIVAEDVAEDIERYLGLHFPASDIPAQARELYVRKISRSIVLGDSDPAPLEPTLNPRTGQPVDTGDAELRSVSPHHVTFMKNMGQEATMSLSLVHQGRLIGMITCAHHAPLVIPYIQRQGFEVLARQVAMQWGGLREIERMTHLDRLRQVRLQLARGLDDDQDLVRVLMEEEPTLLEMIGGDGAVLYLGGHAVTEGMVPDFTVLDRLLEYVGVDGGGDIVASDSLSRDFPDLAQRVPDMAGVMVVPIGSASNYLAWWRRETVRTVQWMGDQTSVNRATPLSPRNSFAQWTQLVADVSPPWEELAMLEAKELRADLNSALLRRVEAELAHLAMHDHLTGLPNRRMLVEVMERGLARRDPPTTLAALFIDLDGFKEINDALGHAQGDALIVAAGTRLREVTRAQDTVARLGGDEFVIVCEVVDIDEAMRTAERVLAAFREPIDLDDTPHLVMLSVGVAVAQPGGSPDELLEASDAAMYRAKKAGKNRISS